MDKNILEDEAEIAVRSRPVAASAWIVEPNSTMDISSGTLVQHRGKCFILTAAHCLREYASHSAEVQVGLPLALPDGRRGLVGGWWCHPDLDVGLVRLQSSAEDSRFLEFAISLEDLCPDPSFAPEDTLLVCGYPVYATDRSDREIGLITVHHGAAPEELRTESPTRWALPWDETIVKRSVVSPHAPPGFLAKQRAREGARERLEMPGGMSGGGWWHIKSSVDHSGRIWNPSRHVSLVAIQSKYVGRPNPMIVGVPLSNDVISWIQSIVASR